MYQKSKLKQLLDDVMLLITEEPNWDTLAGKDLRMPTDAEWEHEMKRIREMSKKELKTRMSKITNPQKMFAFAMALKQKGYDDLSRLAYGELRKHGWSKKGEYIESIESMSFSKISEARDFSNVEVRRIEGAFMEIKHTTDKVLEELEQMRLGDRRDISGEEVRAMFSYEIQKIRQMVDRIIG